MQKQVLIVDDNDLLLRHLARVVAGAGHRAVACNRFQDAKNYLLHNEPDVLLTDIRLGMFNGLQLVILAKDLHPGISMFVYSAFDDPVLQDQAIREGASYVPKAEVLAALLDVIEDRYQPLQPA